MVSHPQAKPIPGARQFLSAKSTKQRPRSHFAVSGTAEKRRDMNGMSMVKQQSTCNHGSPSATIDLANVTNMLNSHLQPENFTKAELFFEHRRPCCETHSALPSIAMTGTAGHSFVEESARRLTSQLQTLGSIPSCHRSRVPLVGDKEIPCLNWDLGRG